MTETEELLRLCVRALALQMHGAPGLALRMTEHAVLGLTDEPLADFNQLLLADGPDAEVFLVRAVAEARERGRPLTAVVSPTVAARLGPLATRLGFAAVGAAPLMALRPEDAPASAPASTHAPMTVARALGPPLTGMAGDLIAAAFDTPRDVVARCIEPGMTPTGAVETHVAWDDRGPLCTVSITLTGDTAGVSLMATPPARQRQGAGRALLSQVIADYRRRGVRRFHLGATDAGLPLYRSLGFRPVADLPVWLLPTPGAGT